MGPTAAHLAGDRFHLQHGPIDLIIGVDGDRKAAFHVARARFTTLLDELVEELPLLRQPQPHLHAMNGTTARRMADATRPLARYGTLTPMAAVAGSVADEVLGTMVEQVSLHRAYVNNGGDIAVFLGPERSYATAIGSPDGRALGRISLHAAHAARGIATSGRHGRSLSLGIADAVTVLAETAAMADAAATVIANAVDLPGHSAITRRPACDVIDDSDLGQLPVVTDVDPLAPQECREALMPAVRRAKELLGEGLIEGAALFLQDEARMIGPDTLFPKTRTPAYA